MKNRTTLPVRLDPSYDKFPIDSQFFEKLIDRKQLAENLAISSSYISKLMANGEIPYLKIGKSVRFRQTEVLAWLQRRTKP